VLTVAAAEHLIKELTAWLPTTESARTKGK
jgi:hypothetical protein